MNNKNQNEQLLNQAIEAAKNAYAPYSKFSVGACVLYESGATYQGCNVENSSYGLTLCAERNAFSNAIVAGEKTKPVAIAIASLNTKLCYPCGACRQWATEFNKNCEVILEDNEGNPKVYNISELLPYTFEL